MMEADCPLVTICIPSFNGERYIAEAIESNLRQTYPNIEILVVDDGSADETGKIVQEFRRKKPDLRYIKNEQNLGLAGNWNKCIGEARGSWIKFHFQDDLASEDCVEKMMAPVLNGSFSGRLVICDREYLFEEGATRESRDFLLYKLPRLRDHFRTDTTVSSGEFNRIWYENLLGANFMGEPIAGLFRKDAVDIYGKYDAGLKQIVDFEYWARIACNEGFYYVNKPLVTFRVHGSSASMANSGAGENISVIDRFILASKIKYAGYFSKFRTDAKPRGDLAKKIDSVLLPWYITFPEAKAIRRNLSGLQESYPRIIPAGFNRRHYIQRIKSSIKSMLTHGRTS